MEGKIMTNAEQFDNLIGSAAVDAEGQKVGKVGQVYVSDATGQPEWVTLNTGLFGSNESFAPLYNSRVEGGQLVLAVSKQLVKDAPQPDLSSEGHLPGDEVEALYRHYAGYLAPEPATGTGTGTGTGSGTADQYQGTDAALGRDTSGPVTDDAMTRSEEQLRVGTQSTEAGRARLRKYVVTEQVTTTVPVSHEEVRIEREPITDANRDAAMAGGDITEEEHEVTLHAEQPVVQKETVPVERVRLGKETVTEQQEVTEQVRKEQIDTPDVDGGLEENNRA
jgi:uncharacterized protein (TIGR02271 family)